MEETIIVEATVDQLKTELNRCISQMQSSSFYLKLNQWMRSKVVVHFLLLFICMLIVIHVFAPLMAVCVGSGSVLAFALAFIKLPWSRSLVKDLRRDAAELDQTTDVLKQRVDKEVWLHSFSNRWRSVEELQKTVADIQGVVETLDSVVNLYLLSDLSKKLKECQQHIRNI